MNDLSLETKSFQQSEIIQSEEYDPYKRPPNIYKARQHATARRFAKPIPNIDLDKENICPCCGLPYQNQQLSLCVSRKEFSFIGSGIVLYFDFIVYTEIILMIYIMLVSAYTLYDNGLGNRCDIENTPKFRGCETNIYNKYSRTNVVKSVDVLVSYLNLTTLIVMIISTLIYRRQMNRICLQIDDAEIEVSDYSIMVSNLPKNCKFLDLKDFFSQDFQMEKVELRKISMAYEIQPYLKLQTELKNKQEDLSNLLETNSKNKPNKKQEILDLEKEIGFVKQKLDYLEKNIEKILTFSGVALLSFNFEKQADFVCETFKTTKFELLLIQLGMQEDKYKKFKGTSIIVRKAPLPGDVLWENLGICVKEQYKKIFITNAVTITLLSAGFFLLFGFSYLQQLVADSVHFTPTAMTYIINILGFASSLMVSITNALLSNIIVKFITREQHSTKTEYDIGTAKKLGLAEFINTAILTLLVNIVIKGEQESTLMTIWQAGGLNSDVMWIFLTDTFFPWFQFLLDFDYLKKLYYRKKIMEQGSYFTQQQANEAFEGPTINLAEKYARVSKTLLIALFYSPLLPACSIFALIGIFGIYWIDKILLLRRDSKPSPTGSQMAQEMVEFYIDLSMLAYSISCCIWEYIVFKEIHWSTWLAMGISGIFYFVPKDDAFDCILSIGIDNPTEQSYDSKYATFLDDYDRRNPVTASIAKQNWMKMQQDYFDVIPTNHFLSVKQLDSIQRNQFGQQLKSRQLLMVNKNRHSAQVYPVLKRNNQQ